MADTIFSFLEGVLGVLAFAAMIFVAIILALAKSDLRMKERSYVALGGTALVLAYAGYQVLFNGDIPNSAASQAHSPNAVTAKDLPYPEVGIPGHVAPEGRTVYLDYRKGEPPVAIHCREVGGKAVCKPAK